MVDIWDLSRFVEDHPGDYEQRWRLAKKLYLACEYRLALEHLQILRNEWAPKLNVVRYLAATLYRLGRYDEAIRELEDAIYTWPEEIGLREQLARVLEVANRNPEAADAWEEIAELVPDHPIARRAAERLRGQRDPVKKEHAELNIDESDSGIDLAPKRICPGCGAQNAAEFDRCWQCHAPLAEGAALAPVAPLPLSTLREHGERSPLWTFAGVAMLVALVGGGAYAAFSGIPRPETELPVPAFATVYDALWDSLMMTRLVVGAVLLFAWPIVLFIALRFVPSDSPGGGVVLLTGCILALLAFGVLWAPFHLLGTLAILLALASLVIIGLLFEISIRDTVLVWMFQLGAMVVIAALAFGGVEGFGALPELPAAVRFAAKHDRAQTPDVAHPAPATKVDALYKIRWESTGSKWLDRKVARTYFRVNAPAPGDPTTFSLREPDGAVLVEEMTVQPFQASYPVNTDIPYELIIRGGPEQAGAPVELTVYGLLPLQVKL